VLVALVLSAIWDDPGMTIDLGDVLRFTGTTYILYSDVPDPNDTGIPILQANTFSGVEDPTGAGMYVAVHPTFGSLTYMYVSDGGTPDVVPEPATVRLMIAGAAMLLLGALLRRRLHAEGIVRCSRFGPVNCQLS
jgi:hypothetical protein